MTPWRTRTLRAWVRRPTRRVQGRIGADTLLQGARVARLAECRREQKMGYGQHTNTFSNSKAYLGGCPLFKYTSGRTRMDQLNLGQADHQVMLGGNLIPLFNTLVRDQ
jgi:hypothetical protein